MKKDEVIAAIEKARKSIDQYLEIMTMLPTIDVSTNKVFQRRFNHFYRVKQRSESWYSEYYSFMEKGKRNPPIFEDVLDHLVVMSLRFRANSQQPSPRMSLFGTNTQSRTQGRKHRLIPQLVSSCRPKLSFKEYANGIENALILQKAY
jgi:hypothetical protein